MPRKITIKNTPADARNTHDVDITIILFFFPEWEIWAMWRYLALTGDIAWDAGAGEGASASECERLCIMVIIEFSFGCDAGADWECSALLSSAAGVGKQWV
jgi:hypothetical protein